MVYYKDSLRVKVNTVPDHPQTFETLCPPHGTACGSPILLAFYRSGFSASSSDFYTKFISMLQMFVTYNCQLTCHYW